MESETLTEIEMRLSNVEATAKLICDLNETLRTENAELRAVVEKLPKTGDGVAITPGQYLVHSRDGEITAVVVEAILDGSVNFEYIDDGSGIGVYFQIHGSVCESIYSTREAAVAAKPSINL
ncbi:MAG: hypothetical protein JKY67_00415 [Pseudomonadales bacterium]|nr:hypothetical protein [Pseudomonadales bacterium]MBL4864822.1 hypothetical protein [Pseudomonadales bacterium]